MKTERFKDKIREYAIANDVRSLPKIGYIEDRIIDYLMDNPLEASKHKHILKQKKQIAGILGQELPTPEQPMVNLGRLQVFWSNMIESRQKEFESKAITEAEIVEDTDK